MKKKKRKYKDFELVPETAGKICAGVYLKEDKSEIIIQFAWGGSLHFKPLTEDYAPKD